jgi:hypothetical protein
MTMVTYHAAKHDGGSGYRAGEVWSETFQDHETALAAAKSAAMPRFGRGATPKSTSNGMCQMEHVAGGDRPETKVVDDE